MSAVSQHCILSCILFNHLRLSPSNLLFGNTHTTHAGWGWKKCMAEPCVCARYCLYSSDFSPVACLPNTASVLDTVLLIMTFPGGVLFGNTQTTHVGWGWKKCTAEPCVCVRNYLYYLIYLLLPVCQTPQMSWILLYEL